MWQVWVIEGLKVILTWAILEAVYGDDLPSYMYYESCGC